MTLKPGQHFWMFMGGIIVDNGVDDFARRDLGLDGVEEADELLVTMALHVAADHAPIKHVESGKERRCAVTLVLVAESRNRLPVG